MYGHRYRESTTATATEQQQQQTSLGAPVAIIPGLTQNVLTIVSFLIGTSSFILGLRIKNASKNNTRIYFVIINTNTTIIDNEQIF